jgi:hypothetical protein
VDHLARVNPALATCWFKEGEPALPLTPTAIERLLRHASQTGDAGLAGRLFRSAIGRGGHELRSFFEVLRSVKGELPAGFRAVADTALELLRARGLLRSSKLLHLSDAPGTFDLEQGARLCPVQLAAYLAWLVFLCRHRQTSELFRIDLRDWLFQAVVNAGWTAQAKKLARRFPFLRIGPDRLSPRAYLERGAPAAPCAADPELALDFLRLLRNHLPCGTARPGG